MGVAEEGLDAQGIELVVAGELSAVVEEPAPAKAGVTVSRRGCGRSASIVPSIWLTSSACLVTSRVPISARLERSCSMRMFWPYFEKAIRSASQWPGICRSDASWGLRTSGTRWAMKEAGERPFIERRPRLALARGR